MPGGGWPDYVVCAALDGAGDEPDAVRSAVEAVLTQVQEDLPREQRALLGPAHTNAVYFCGRWPEHPAGLPSRLEALRRSLETASDATCTIGLAWLPQAGLSGLQWAAQRAIVAQRRKVRTGSGRVYVFDRDEPRPPEAAPFLALMADVQMAVKRGDATAATAASETLARSLFHEAYVPLPHLRPLLQTHVILAAQAAIEAGDDAEYVESQREAFLAAVGSEFDYDALIGIVTDAACEFAAVVESRFVSVSERLVAVADEFIRERFADPNLGLAKVAKRVACSPTHLSRTFKRLKGVGVSASINARRMERAMALLADPQQTVSAAAFEAGFGSVQNMGRVFRASTGVSPSTWRRAHTGP